MSQVGCRKLEILRTEVFHCAHTQIHDFRASIDGQGSALPVLDAVSDTQCASVT